MAKKYVVTLAVEERELLKAMIGSGIDRARKLTRARVLLKANECWPDKEIRRALDVGTATIERVRRRYVEESVLNP